MHINDLLEEKWRTQRKMAALRDASLMQDQKTRPSTMQRNSNIKSLLKKIQKKNIFQSIDNPVEWQRTIRDEWS